MSKVDKTDVPKKGLDLVPNEVIGYRISPEPHNWTVALVKKKASGLEYKTPMSYHKHLSGAVGWIYNTVALNEGRALQNESLEKTNIACDPEVLKEAFERGLAEALKAVRALEQDMVNAGLSPKNLSLQAFEMMQLENPITESE